ncbi:MAG TPA: LEA type 2 family protein [bacterium]|nr:LEA type 2 family protein [bacterium]HPN42809.1 LEA type 2 family protein [bacterium]
MKKSLYLFIVILFIAGCSSLQQLVQRPTVKVSGVDIASANFDQITLDFGLLIHNPNSFGIQMDGFDYNFVLEGNEFLKGNENRQIQILSQNNSTVKIPVTIAFKELYNLVTKTKTLDTLSYHIEGHIRPGGLLSGFNIPFSKTGSLPNIRIPELSLKSLKVDKMSLSGIDLKLGIDLKNNNIFGFDIGKLNYNINLGGSKVASGITDKLASVPAKGNGEIVLPISLDFLGLSSSLKSLLTGQNIDCAIAGDADLNTPFGMLNLPINTTQNVKIFK